MPFRTQPQTLSSILESVVQTDPEGEDYFMPLLEFSNVLSINEAFSLVIMLLIATEENKMFAVVQLHSHNNPDGIISHINRAMRSRKERVGR